MENQIRSEQTSNGFLAEDSLAQIFRVYGRSVQQMKKTHVPFDLLVDGLRVEVKTARPSQHSKYGPIWSFNIHRHGKIKEGLVDLYILVFEKVPYCINPIYAAFKSPLSTPTLNFSLRQMIAGNLVEAVKLYKSVRGSRP